MTPSTLTKNRFSEEQIVAEYYSLFKQKPTRSFVYSFQSFANQYHLSLRESIKVFLDSKTKHLSQEEKEKAKKLASEKSSIYPEGPSSDSSLPLWTMFFLYSTLLEADDSSDYSSSVVPNAVVQSGQIVPSAEKEKENKDSGSSASGDSSGSIGGTSDSFLSDSISSAKETKPSYEDSSPSPAPVDSTPSSGSGSGDSSGSGSGSGTGSGCSGSGSGSGSGCSGCGG